MKLKKILLLPVWIVGGVLGTAALGLVALNLLKKPIYRDYYNVESKVAELPPFKDGYVHQGTSGFVEDGKNYYVTCGYMADKVSSSRVYVVDEDENRKYIELKNPDNSNFLGHTGGITCNANGITYLASGDTIYEIPTEILSLKSEVNEFKLTVKHDMQHSCSAISSIGNSIWIAEFHGHEYNCKHEYTTSEGVNHAIAVKYNLADLSKPVEVYSIRDLVQGIAENPKNNDVVLSCSYGLADSHYYLYNTSNYETLEGKTLFDCQVKAFINPYNDIKAPAMSEDLEYFNGKVITAQESGSKKYIYGIFFFDKYIHSLDI